MRRGILVVLALVLSVAACTSHRSSEPPATVTAPHPEPVASPITTGVKPDGRICKRIDADKAGSIKPEPQSISTSDATLSVLVVPGALDESGLVGLVTVPDPDAWVVTYWSSPPPYKGLGQAPDGSWMLYLRHKVKSFAACMKKF